MQIRKSTLDDIPRMREIFAHARRFMAETGNPFQWTDDYPGEDFLRNDIESGDSYVCLSEGKIVATFLLRGGIDPTYNIIYEGTWPDDAPYATIHRIASSGEVKGILHAAMTFALQHYSNIRIDTHRDNLVMQNALKKEGFRYCGIINCWSGDERLAYQYKLHDMNITINDIKSRRSVKKYLDKEVPRELIAQIAEAGTYAPTGMNRQSPVILAVTDPALRDRLSRMNAQILGTESDPFYGAPVVLVVLARKDVSTRVYDGSLVMQNLMLAAHSLGIGSCWIHRAKETFESEEGKDILRSLGITEELEGIGNCVVGYAAPDAVKPQSPRKDGYVVWA